MSPVDTADLVPGAVIRATHGPHAGTLSEVRRVKTTAVELRVMPGQNRPGTNRGNKRVRYDMPIDDTLRNSELVRRPREKRVQNGVHPQVEYFDYAKREVAPLTTEPQTVTPEPKAEVAPPPPVYPRFSSTPDKRKMAPRIRQPEMMAILEQHGIGRTEFDRALRAWGVTGLARRWHVSPGPIEKARDDWKIPGQGHGFNPPGVAPGDIERIFNFDFESEVRAYQQANGLQQPKQSSKPPSAQQQLHRRITAARSSVDVSATVSSAIAMLEADRDRLKEEIDERNKGLVRIEAAIRALTTSPMV